MNDLYQLRDQITKLCPALAYKQKNGDWFNVSSFLYYQELANGEVEPIDESSGTCVHEIYLYITIFRNRKRSKRIAISNNKFSRV